MNSLPCCMSASIRRTLEVITAWVKSRVTRHICMRSSIRAGTSQRPCCTYLPACCLITSASLAADAFGRSAVSPASSPSVRAEGARSSRVSSSSALSLPSPPVTRSASTTRSRSSCDARMSGISSGIGSQGRVPVQARFPILLSLRACGLPAHGLPMIFLVWLRCAG